VQQLPNCLKVSGFSMASDVVTVKHLSEISNRALLVSADPFLFWLGTSIHPWRRWAIDGGDPPGCTCRPGRNINDPW